MSKNRLLSVATASLLLSNISFAETQTMVLEAGWNLKGSKLENAEVKSDDIFWKYSDEQWSQEKSVNAGDGFWIKAQKEDAIFLKGDSSLKTLSFSKSGWHLVSPIAGSLPISSIDEAKVEDILIYKSGQWLNREAMIEKSITKIEVGDGFWIKTVQDDLSVDNLSADTEATADAVTTGSVDLSSIINPITGEAISSRSNRESVNPITGEVIPDEAIIQVYEADDEDFSTPLLKSDDPVSINPITGEYIIQAKHFVNPITGESITNRNGDVVNPITGKIIRVIAKKDNKNYELSALATESSRVDVNPITTTIRTKILDTIKTMFGAEFVSFMKSDSSIMSSINSLASAIAVKVEQDIKDGKVTLRKTDFQTDKEPSAITNPLTGEEITAKEQKEEKLKTQLTNSSSSSDLSKFENEVSIIKKESVDRDSIDLSKKSSSAEVARIEYDTVSSLAKMGFAIHDGAGRVITFLPVPAEEIDKLPGKKYQINVKDEVIGGEPELRVIDVTKDLKNSKGNEEWAFMLTDSLLYSPIIAYENIKTLVKKELAPTPLIKLGEFLATKEGPYGKSLFKENPLKPLTEIEIDISEDPEESVKELIKPYEKPLLAQNLIWLQNDFLFNAIDENRAEEFLEVFSTESNPTVENFIEGFRESPEFKDFIRYVGTPLAKSIPPKYIERVVDEPNLLRLSDDAQLSSETKILPATGIALTNMLMSTAGLQNIEIETRKLSDILGEDIPEGMDGNMEIYWAIEKEVDTGESAKDPVNWSAGFITSVISNLTDTEVKTEARFEKLITDIKKSVKEFEKKVEERESQFFSKEFFSGESIESTVTFQVVDWDETPMSKVQEVTFTPHIENIDTFEVKEATSKAITLKPVDKEARFKGAVTVWGHNLPINESGEKDENGEWRFVENYVVSALLESGERVQLEILPLFPIERNDLEYIFIDNPDMPTEMGDEFHSQIVNQDEKSVYYPIWMGDRALIEFEPESFTFKRLDGVRVSVMAENWEGQDEIWSNPVMPKPKEEEFVEQFAIVDGGIEEGALIFVDVKEESWSEHILMSIDFVDRELNEIGITLSPFPEDTFDSEFIGDDGNPVCKTTEGVEITLPLLEDEYGSYYPIPGDPEYPKECDPDMFEEVPTCFVPELDENGEVKFDENGYEIGKEIKLPKLDSGDYPWPGDAEYPKECAVYDDILGEFEDDKFDYNSNTGAMENEFDNSMQNSEKPICIDYEGNEVEIPWNDETDNYALPNDGVWGTICDPEANSIDNMGSGEFEENYSDKPDYYDDGLNSSDIGSEENYNDEPNYQYDKATIEMLADSGVESCDVDNSIESYDGAMARMLDGYLDREEAKNCYICDTDESGDIDELEIGQCIQAFKQYQYNFGDGLNSSDMGSEFGENYGNDATTDYYDDGLNSSDIDSEESYTDEADYYDSEMYGAEDDMMGMRQ